MVFFKRRLEIIPKIKQKIKLISSLLVILLMCVFVFMVYPQENEYTKLVEIFPEKFKCPVSLQKVTVHLDLKGSPPKLDYLRRLLPVLKEHGVNSLLMEYEDMFPYENNLVNLSSPHKYSRQELKKFLTTAVLQGFEIIPLVQTFGHLEYVLKLPEFEHLREEPHCLESICPTKNESLMLIKDMLAQVIEFHEKIAPLMHIHIGCDEVYHINICSKCQNRMLSNSELYIGHVETVVATVKLLSPKTTILMWDDMFRQIKPGPFYKLTSSIISDVELVVWDYNPQPIITYFDFFKYKSFGNIWIATAFKGAESPTATIPNITRRYHNHFEWMTRISKYKFGGNNGIFRFKGVVLTGWSRYNHTAPLCELLPPSMPSLILNLILIKIIKQGVTYPDCHNKLMSQPNDFYEKYLKLEFMKKLKCKSIVAPKFNTVGCDFDGNKVYKLLIMFETSIRDRWKNTSYNYIDSNSKDLIEHGVSEIDLYGVKLALSLVPYYDKFVVDEYVNSTIHYQKEQLREMLLYLCNKK